MEVASERPVDYGTPARGTANPYYSSPGRNATNNGPNNGPNTPACVGTRDGGNDASTTAAAVKRNVDRNRRYDTAKPEALHRYQHKQTGRRDYVTATPAATNQRRHPE
jgi:hypothetical protein